MLGGIEPARTLVIEALNAGIPVVTANKTLLAYCGAELFAAAAAAGVPLLYEASVLAGVPFLGTLGRRPLARSVTGFRGILNGTSNFVLSRMARDGASFDEALASAQRAGFAEPDPSKDIEGDDAVEKLCVLLRHLAGSTCTRRRSTRPESPASRRRDQQHAAAFGGTVRPVVVADWSEPALAAYAGPAYVEGTNALSRVDGVQNAIALTTLWSGELFFSGPGAGPTVTAATVLDDVVEASRNGETVPVESQADAAGHVSERRRLVHPPHLDVARRGRRSLAAGVTRHQAPSRLAHRRPLGPPFAVAPHPSLRPRAPRRCAGPAVGEDRVRRMADSGARVTGEPAAGRLPARCGEARIMAVRCSFRLAPCSSPAWD